MASATAIPATRLPRPKLEVYRKTDVGRVRDHNEDSSYADPLARYFVVADGMGGHAAGEVASQLAVDEVRACLDRERDALDNLGSAAAEHTKVFMTALIERTGRQANAAIRKRASEDRRTRGMGTTLEFLVVTADGAWIGHVGDSRTYLVRDLEVTQLTTDHTFAEHLSKNQEQAAGDIAKQWGNVLIEAVGAKDEVQVDVIHTDIKKGDRLLLCSDGLHGYFPRTAEIGEILALDGSAAGLDRLVHEALARGGKDNITGLLVEIVETPASRTTAAPAVEWPSAAEQDYGVEEATALLRKLPAENLELVVRVMKAALESANIGLPPIIEDAETKLRRIDHRVAALQAEIAELENDKAHCSDEIARHEEDLEETIMVRERLQLALRLGKPTA